VTFKDGSRNVFLWFAKAAGHSPLAYVQNLRIEAAKRRLERTGKPVDEISSEVGYDNPAFFRRVFKRNVRMTPSAYRRKFLIPRVPVSRRSHRPALATKALCKV
jgi:transcriptional regulator GlxA family with amidase domain